MLHFYEKMNKGHVKMVKVGLSPSEKICVIASKFMTSQPGLQTIVIHMLPNISQRKGNQTMKFGQLN